MIEIVQKTMELRFKKSMPKVSFDIHAPVQRPQIFLQQMVAVTLFDETKKESTFIPMGINPDDVIPPQLRPHTNFVGRREDGALIVEIPTPAGSAVRWVNVPAVDDNSPDEITA